MAVSSGTSVPGLQLLGAFGGSGVGWEVRFASAQNLDRRRQFGALLVCQPISNGRFPVVQAYRLFGGGARPPLLNVPTYVGLQVWVNWQQAGLNWFFERADP